MFWFQLTEKIVKISLFVGMVTKSVSIVFLIGAVILTLAVRNIRFLLRQNDDMKIHLNLYLALLCSSAVWLAIDGVQYVMLTDPSRINNPVRYLRSYNIIQLHSCRICTTRTCRPIWFQWS